MFVEQVKSRRGRANIALSTTATPAKIKLLVAYGFSMCLESQLITLVCGFSIDENVKIYGHEECV